MAGSYTSFLVRVWGQDSSEDASGLTGGPKLGQVYNIQSGTASPFNTWEEFHQIVFDTLKEHALPWHAGISKRRENMSVESTRGVIMRYLESNHTDLDTLAEEVVFTMMGSGEETRGKEAVQGMLAYFYSHAFEAHAEDRNILFWDGKAVYEGDFVGQHIGEFAGIPPTGQEVRVPMCIVYELASDRIQEARIYFAMGVLMAQLKVGRPDPQPAG
jgi:predicted ester cyclase